MKSPIPEIKKVFELMGLQKRWSASYVSSIHFTALILQRKVSSLFAVYMVCLPQTPVLHHGSKILRTLDNLPKIEGSK